MPRTITLWFGLMLAAVVLSHDAAAHPVHEVQVMASKPGFDPSTIEITAGEPVRLVIRSKDVVHGFAVPKLHIDVQIPKSGEPVTVEFIAPPPGRYEIACSEYCGSSHGRMKAALISVAAAPATP
jgi:heme/copper-type cytochrome/quinol oxidase subunit 2